MEETTIKEIAEQNNLLWNKDTSTFGKWCFEHGRQSIFKAQAKGREKRKLSGKPLGRPRGSKDSKDIKRDMRKKYRYYIFNSRFFKQLPEHKQESLKPQIESIHSHEDYVILFDNVKREWLVEGLGGINEIL